MYHNLKCNTTKKSICNIKKQIYCNKSQIFAIWGQDIINIFKFVINFLLYFPPNVPRGTKSLFRGGCLGVDLSTREGYSVKKTVLYTVFSCKSVATAKPGRMQGNAEAAVPPYNNLRPRQRSAANADGRDCRGAQAGQHDAAVSVPRTLSRGALHRNQRHFWYFWCQKYRY